MAWNALNDLVHQLEHLSFGLRCLNSQGLFGINSDVFIEYAQDFANPIEYLDGPYYGGTKWRYFS